MLMLGLIGLGWWEVVLIGGLGLLIFGRRLPDLGRSLGRSVVEFQKGLRGIEADSSATPTQAQLPPPQDLR